MTDDDRFAQLDQEFPGFAGFFVDDSQQRLMMRFARPIAAPRLRQVQERAAAVLDEPYLLKLAPEAVPAEFDFVELKRWYEPLAYQVMSLPGVVTSDIDERRNRIVIGVQSPASQATAVQQLIRRLDIPSDAVTIKQLAAIRALAGKKREHAPGP
jgi:hypothetical protein